MDRPGPLGIFHRALIRRQVTWDADQAAFSEVITSDANARQLGAEEC